MATVDGAELAALAQEIARAPELGAPTRESARNRFTGLVTRVVKDTVMARRAASSFAWRARETRK